MTLVSPETPKEEDDECVTVSMKNRRRSTYWETYMLVGATVEGEHGEEREIEIYNF